MRRTVTRFLWVLVYLLTAIGILMVIRRTLAIAGLIPSFTPRGGPPGGQPFDSDFSRHPVITFIHMLPGALFLILGLLQFNRGIRERPNSRIRMAFIFVGYIVGISALCLPFILKPIGGLNEAAASTLFALSGLPIRVFFGTAFWLGFTIHAMAAEVFINYTRNPENPKFVSVK